MKVSALTLISRVKLLMQTSVDGMIGLKQEVLAMTEIKKEQPQLPDGWSDIKRAKASARTGWAYFGDLVKLLHKELGEEKTVAILTNLMEANVKKYVKRSMEVFGVEGNDPWSIATYFKLATGDIIGYKAELIQEAPNRVVYRLHPPCLWFPDLDIPPSFCEALCMFEKAAARLLNPRVKVSTRSLMTRGDPYCENVFEEDK